MNPDNSVNDGSNIKSTENAQTVIRPTAEPSTVTSQVITAQVNPASATSQTTTQPITPAPIQSYSQMMEEQRTGASRRIIVLVIATVFLLAGVIGGIFALSSQNTNKALSASNQFIADLKTNNPGQAYNLFAPAAQQAISESQLDQIFNELAPGAQGAVKVTGKYIYKQAGKPEAANIVYLIGGSNGGYLEIALQHNSSWQLYNINVSNSPLSASAVSSAKTSSKTFNIIFPVFGLFILVLGMIGVFYPEVLWRITKWQNMWQYKNNEEIEPSSSFLIYLRLMSVFIIGVAIVILFIFTQQTPLDTIF